MIMKDAKTGGAWAWHQDYGYWYQNGVAKYWLITIYYPEIKRPGS
jgi:hypothetical protein